MVSEGTLEMVQGGWVPTELGELDLAEPMPDLPARAATRDGRSAQVQMLVRLHGVPLGICRLAPENRFSPDELGATAWQTVRAEATEHLQADGLEIPRTVGAEGLPAGHTPACLRERERFLQRAPEVSVVVATRDRPARLRACLDSLLAMDYPRFEVIVADNVPSSDDTAHLLRDRYAAQPNVHYVREDAPGAAAARNRGARGARHGLVAFLDDDVLVDRGWLTAVARAFDVARDVGCVTGLILPAELDTPAQTLLEEYGGFAKGFARRVFDPHEPRAHGRLFPYAVGSYGSGANMAFRAAYLGEAHGFDPALGPGTLARGGEDLAAFAGILLNGHSLVYEPGAIVRHFHGADYASLRRQIEGYGVGLGACLTKLVVDEPARALDIAVRLPAGFDHLLSGSSPKNRKKGAQYPVELTLRELSGLLRGPFAYLLGRLALAQTTTAVRHVGDD